MKRLVAFVLFFLVLSPVLNGSTIAQVTVSELIKGSEFIFQGRVIGLAAYIDPGSGDIFTKVTFEVIERIKGSDPRSHLDLVFMGGTVSGRTLRVGDMRFPDLGEIGFYFVESLSRKQVHPLYGWAQGHYLVEPDAAGTSIVTNIKRQPVRQMVAEAPAKATIGAPRVALGVTVSEGSEPGMTASQFKARIKQIGGLK